MSRDQRIDVGSDEDLQDNDARGFDYEEGGRLQSGFVVRHGGSLRAWRNVCPHAGHQLNWKPHAFLTRDRSRIMCSVHGAVFEPDTGLCVGGPCPGRRLTPMAVAVISNRIVVTIPESEGD